MLRQVCLLLSGMRLHAIQRGNYRQACFFAKEDYRFWPEWLAGYASKIGCQFYLSTKFE